MKLFAFFFLICCWACVALAGPAGRARECPVVCTADYTPVCGRSPNKGDKTFSNACQIRVENQCRGGNYYQLHTGPC